MVHSADMLSTSAHKYWISRLISNGGAQLVGARLISHGVGQIVAMWLHVGAQIVGALVPNIKHMLI